MLILKEAENQIVIYDEGGNLLKSFEVKENLQRALEILKQLNLVKTIDGVPVYRTRMFKGISVWSFHQNVLFWHFLRHYVKYEEVIKFLVEKKVEKVIIESEIGNLKEYLRINEIKIVNDSFEARKARSFFIAPLMRFAALKLTLLALFKALIFRTALLVYTPDKFSKKHGCDFRFYPVYQYLREKKIPYIELFHTLLNREFFQNIFNRKRLAFYLEVFPVFFRIKEESREYDLSSFELHNRKYFQHLLEVIDQRAQNSIRRVRALAWFLKFTKIKTLVAMDDLRYISELILACRLSGIKAYGFQHGFLSKYQTGWLNYNIPKELSIAFDKYFVWSDYWLHSLLPYSTQYGEENTIVGGVLREPEPISYKKRGLKIEKVSDLNILVPYESFVPKEEVRYYLLRLLDLGARIYFKVRPDMSYDQQSQEYGIWGREGVELVEKINQEVLEKIDAVGGTYTTFLNDMIFYEKPLFLFDTSFDFGHRLREENLGCLLSKDFVPSALLDYINNYQSKKDRAWPPTNLILRETLDGLKLGVFR